MKKSRKRRKKESKGGNIFEGKRLEGGYSHGELRTESKGKPKGLMEIQQTEQSKPAKIKDREKAGLDRRWTGRKKGGLHRECE